MNKNIKLYNMLLPIWLIIFFPTWLWLLLIPANYIIDRLVLRWGVNGMPDAGEFCRKHTWKICLAGFASDFIGCLPLLAMMGVDTNNERLYAVSNGVLLNPFTNVWSFVIVAAAAAIAGIAIFKIDKDILIKAGLSAEMAQSAAFRLAIITAPYIYFLPSEIIY